MQLAEQVEASADGRTVWVHAVGRFSLQFGMDAHTTITEQLAGAAQCLHCGWDVLTRALSPVPNRRSLTPGARFLIDGASPQVLGS